MKVKFNRFERVAGLFVMGALAGSVAMAVAIAVKRGVFEPKIDLQTSLQTADGIREGTLVTMQGLRIGQVTAVQLISAKEVIVSFKMNREYIDKVRMDSVVRVVRPFIIGEKVLDISIGDPTSLQVADGQSLVSEPSADIMDLLSGRTLGPAMDMMGRLAQNLKYVAEAFLAPERTKAMVRIFDELSPMIRNASSLTREANSMLLGMNKKQQLVTMVGNLAEITSELHKAMPTIAKESPEMLEHLSKIAKNMAVLTDEISKTLPMMQKLAPEIPRASERALEALDETVVTLKALQKSFILRGSAREVREEEAIAAKKKEADKTKADEPRNPSSEKTNEAP